MCQIKECLMLPNLLVITAVAALALAPGTAGDDGSERAQGTCCHRHLNKWLYLCLSQDPSPLQQHPHQQMRSVICTV